MYNSVAAHLITAANKKVWKLGTVFVVTEYAFLLWRCRVGCGTLQTLEQI